MPSFLPEVIISDSGSPEMDGYELCRRLRERFDLPGVMLIALTGWGQMRDLQMSKRAGFHHHLVKPVDPGYLIKLLGRRQLAVAWYQIVWINSQISKKTVARLPAPTPGLSRG